MEYNRFKYLKSPKINFQFTYEDLKDHNFNDKFLRKFWNNFHDLVEITYFIGFSFGYYYFFNTLPVKISFTDLNLYIFECPTCNILLETI